MARLLDALLGDRIERLETERAVLRDRCRRLLGENGRLRRLLTDRGVDPDTGRPANPDDELLRRAFSEPLRSEP